MRILVCLIALLLSTLTASAQAGLLSGAPVPVTTPVFNTVVFNCTSFATSGAGPGQCGVQGLISGSGPFQVVGTTNGTTPTVSGGIVNVINANADEMSLTLGYRTLVNIQKFQTTFNFVPNGSNVAIMFNNSNNNPSFNGENFSGGAGCESGFFQGFSQNAPPNNVFALQFDSFDPFTAAGTFSYSSAQVYTPGVNAANAPLPPGQSPCNPDLGNNLTCGCYTYHSVTKISTFPVPLTTGCVGSGSCTRNTTTGHTYQAQLTYDGSTLTLNLFDVTGGGTCTPITSGSCFNNVWTGINIPGAVGANTAWIGITGGAGTLVAPNPMLVGPDWEYLTP